MDNREKIILKAATEAFLRYGVKRTSMGDIAEEAGVARQTLYNLFANKNDILRGSIRAYGKEALAAIDAELGQQQSVEGKLAIVFREMVLNPYAFLHSGPHAQDLIDGYNDAGKDEIEANSVAFRARIEQVLSPSTRRLSEHGLSPARLAELAQLAGSAAKYQAKDEAHLKALIDELVSLLVAATTDQSRKA